jgi:NAD(P)-dependent dehydrogenase (short-subunit alcohol dehydrogenase family)
MRILVVGSKGTIGSAVVKALSAGNEIIEASRSHTAIKVDIRDAQSIRDMYKRVGRVDAVVSAAGSGAWKPLAELTDDDFQTSLQYKLMGQVNLIRYGFEHVADRGSFTVTSGILSRDPMAGGAAISLVNAGLDGFVRGSSIEAPRGIRVNVVSPPWVTETLEQMGMKGVPGLPAAVVARAYALSVNGAMTGQVIEPA